MTPLDWLATSDWTVPLALVGLVLTIVFVMRQVRAFHPVAPPRVDHRIPERERVLLGDDWRIPVAGFFSERFIRGTRRRMAIYSVCGVVLKESDPATVDRPGS